MAEGPAPALAMAYPGVFSCGVQIENFCGASMLNGHSIIEGEHEVVPKCIRFSNIFGLWEESSDKRLLGIFSYEIHCLRVAFEILIDESFNFFCLGFVPFVEGLKLTKHLQGTDWLVTEWGSSQDQNVAATLGAVKVIGNLSPGKKCVFRICLDKAN